MLENPPRDFSLSHIGKQDPRVRTYAERVGGSLVKIGTDWPINDEPACDPLFVVMFDNDRKIARATAWTMENLMFQLTNGGAIVERYGCTFDSEEPQSERNANDFLYEWLGGVARERQGNPQYFQRISN